MGAEALNQLALTRLLWVLTPQPPHKPGLEISPAQTRLEMLRLAISAEARFQLSQVELDRPGPHYTIETARLLQTQFPAAQLVFLMGGDSLRDLPGWKDPAELIRLCRLGVMRRPSDQIELAALERILPGISAQVSFLNAPLLEISSREIRQRAQSGASFRYYLPEKVYDYIQQHQLYR